MIHVFINLCAEVTERIQKIPQQH